MYVLCMYSDGVARPMRAISYVQNEGQFVLLSIEVIRIIVFRKSDMFVLQPSVYLIILSRRKNETTSVTHELHLKRKPALIYLKRNDEQVHIAPREIYFVKRKTRYIHYSVS